MNEMIMPDIPRSYTALAQCLSCLILILSLRNRFARWKTLLLAAGFLALQTCFMVLTEDVAVYLWIPCMAAAVLLMMLQLYCCCDISVCDCVYFGLLAFVMSELIASLEWELFCSTLGSNYPDRWQMLAVLLATDIILGILLHHILKHHMPQDGRLNASWKEVWPALIISVSVFTVSNLAFVGIEETTPMEYSIEIGNVRTLVDVGGVAILYAYLLQCCEMRVRRELEAVQNVLQNQYVQYKQSRESIDLINYKYHDLKHQIAYLRAEEDPKKREQMLCQMEEEIQRYDAQNKTGNKVLDTILTAKSLYCARHGITFTCVADGKILDFMDTMDICSIFGNALDNAVEGVMKIPDKEKRLIHVTVSRQKAFILLRFENYYEEELRYQQGNLATTKKEKDFHGYGLKSIGYTAAKYEGTVTIAAENNWFVLNILIPGGKSGSAAPCETQEPG